MGDSLDLLSAALDESGITGCDLEFDSGFDDSLLTTQPAPSVETEEVAQSQNENTEVDLDQVDLFTNALKQMAATSYLQPIESENSNAIKQNIFTTRTITRGSTLHTTPHIITPTVTTVSSAPRPSVIAPPVTALSVITQHQNHQAVATHTIQPSSTAYRPQLTSTPYRPQLTSTPYRPQLTSTPYRPQLTSTPYRTQLTSMATYSKSQPRIFNERLVRPQTLVLNQLYNNKPISATSAPGLIPSGARVISLKPMGRVIPTAATVRPTTTPCVQVNALPNTSNARVMMLNSAISKLNASSLTNAQRVAALNALAEKLNSVPGQGNIKIKIIKNPVSNTVSTQSSAPKPAPTSVTNAASPSLIKLTPYNNHIHSPHVTAATKTITINRMPVNTPRVIINPQHCVNGTSMIHRHSPITVAGLVHSNIQPSVIQPAMSLPATKSLLANGFSQPSKVTLTDKDVSRMWSNEDIKLKNVIHASQMSQEAKQLVEDDAEEEIDELGHAETYSDYMPQKSRLGEKHPDPVVETSSLSSVESPDIWYRLAIPEEVIDCGELSALQLETVVYASQMHETMLPGSERAGFLIGDGAGVGKGRTIAGIIYENYLLGRKRAIWLSVSSDLKVDAERDLRDIGAGKIDVYPLNKFKYAKITSRENGSVKKGVIFSTYSSLIGESHSEGKYRTRLKQLLHWCGRDFDGLIVFDECHKAKNLCPVGSSKPTKTGQTVLDLQNQLPNARVVYASATGASEPKNMAYMTRLGLWGDGTPFKEFNDFIQAVEKRGVGAMELVAMEMKLRGMYIARQLSFHGVSFRVEDIPLAKHFVKVYNESVKMWVDAREKFQTAAALIDAEHRMRKSMWGQFWSAHQRFFKYLCISAKVSHCVRLAREAVKNGKCVVIGLQSTGEARTLEQLEEMGGELNDFVSTAKGVFQTLVEKHFPAPDRRKTVDLINSGNRNGSGPPSPGSKKRKRGTANDKSSKRTRKSSGTNDDDSSSSGGESSEGGDSGEGSESSGEDEPEEHEEDDSYTDSYNPFAGGSDSDEDPWLKVRKNISPKAKKNKVKTPKEKKKIVKKKKNKKHKKEKKFEEDEEDSFDEDMIDAQFDKALASAGLFPKIGNIPESMQRSNGFKVPKDKANTSPDPDAFEKAMRMKQDLLESLVEVGDKLPPNTLDQLIDELGGPENVAEMTGRKGRVVSTDDGVSYESRSECDVPLEYLNLTEKQRFMDGEKYIAIISEAASSGISLQSDRRVVNQRRRVHITLELPWSADRAIQQFGRTHRSNQVNAPEYVFLISQLAGEQRFASTVAKRLESLGALTHGDRRATETRDLSRFNFDNKYGRSALEIIMKSVVAPDGSVIPPPNDYGPSFFKDLKESFVGVGLLCFVSENSNIVTLDKDYQSITKFLNRLLGMPIALQNAVFQFFSDSLTAVILEAKRCGQWDLGILDLGSGSESVQKLETKMFQGNSDTGTAKTQLHTIMVERGLSWSGAMDLWRQYSGNDDGFYLSLQMRNGKRTAMLVMLVKTSSKKERSYHVYRPNTGLQPRMEPLADVKKKYRRVYPDDAQEWWMEQYRASRDVCIHAYWKGNCKSRRAGLSCEVGLRTREYHVLAGSVLSVWSKVERVIASVPGVSQSKMQIIRLRTHDGQRIVGSLIPSSCVPALIIALSCDKQKHKTETFGITKQEQQLLSMPNWS